MSKIIECVLNFSEGTDLSLIEDVTSAITTARVLDIRSDPDHNRTVVTFVGEPEGVRQGAFGLTERAMQLLDVREHTGAHPFIGVVDVIPFIPISECSMLDACNLAYGLGKELWQKLELPVYFYGDAAKISKRKDLPYVRKGGYAALKREINLPERKPDIGHGLHVTAGAVAVGARELLIAFNINLGSADISIAQSIAKNIREKSGGLPGVRALGLELKSRGIIQVSINITNQETTSMKEVFDEVKKWAKEYKVEIVESEIVGLIPASAAFPEMREHLKLRNFSETIIIDNYL